MLTLAILRELIHFLDFDTTLSFLSINKSLHQYIKQKTTRSFIQLIANLNKNSFPISSQLLKPKKWSSLLVYLNSYDFQQRKEITYLSENFDTLKCCLLTLRKNKRVCDIVDLLERTFRILKTSFWIVESNKIQTVSICLNYF
jgi:hypothetical protein